MKQLIPNNFHRRAFKRKLNQKKEESTQNRTDDDKDNTDNKTENNHYNDIVGLSNLGNTCYLNSTIQVLLHSKDFVEYFRNETFNTCKYTNYGSLLYHWRDLCKNTDPKRNTNFKTFTPRKFRSALSKIDQRWGNGGQDDAIFVLLNILKAIDNDLNKEKDINYDEVKPKGEILLNNIDIDEDLFHDYNEVKLIKNNLLPNYNPNNSIVRELFDGILFQEAICCDDNCKYQQKKYIPFRFIRLPLYSSIVTLKQVDIYILNEKVRNVTMKKCELIGHCNINTMKYNVKQWINDNYHDSALIYLKNIKIGYLKATKTQNINHIIKYMNNKDLCHDLLNKRIFVIVQVYDEKDNDKYEPIIIVQCNINNNYAISLELKNRNTVNDELNEYLKKNKDLYPLLYVNNTFIEYDEMNLFKVTQTSNIIMIAWIDLELYQHCKNHVEANTKFKASRGIDCITAKQAEASDILEYIQMNKLLFDHNEENENYVGIKDEIFKRLNEELSINTNNMNNNTRLTIFKDINGSLNEYFKTMIFDDNSFAMFCKQCNQNSKIIKLKRKIALGPKHLILYLNRCNAKNKYNLSKFNHSVKYDIKGMKINKFIYNLSGCVNHSGSLKGGHYTANIKSIYKDDLWFYASDNSTSKISTNSVHSRNSIVLIYEKK